MSLALCSVSPTPPVNGVAVDTVERKPSWSAPTPEGMRTALSAFPTGVTLVAAVVDGRPIGMLVNSFTSVSLEPPLVSVNLSRASGTWLLLQRAQHWGISVLGEQNEADFRRLSRPANERFQGVDWLACEDGSVLLPHASAKFTVEGEAHIDAGDHVIALRRVLALHRDAGQEPLVFFGSQIHRLSA